MRGNVELKEFRNFFVKAVLEKSLFLAGIGCSKNRGRRARYSSS